MVRVEVKRVDGKQKTNEPEEPDTDNLVHVVGEGTWDDGHGEQEHEDGVDGSSAVDLAQRGQDQRPDSEAQKVGHDAQVCARRSGAVELGLHAGKAVGVRGRVQDNDEHRKRHGRERQPLVPGGPVLRVSSIIVTIPLHLKVGVALRVGIHGEVSVEQANVSLGFGGHAVMCGLRDASLSEFGCFVTCRYL